MERLIHDKLILLIVVLALTSVTLASALAQTEPQTEPTSGIQGFITSVSDVVVLVEEDPADEWGSDKGAFTVTEETEILRQQGEQPLPASFEDLQVGQLVMATYAGPSPSLILRRGRPAAS